MSRISKVITKTGDKGETGLGDGSRVSKSHTLVCFLGEIDELNSYLGRVISSCNKDKLVQELQSIQQDLFNMGGEAAMPNSELNLLNKDRVLFLENRIAFLNEKLPPLDEFILPGGDEFCSKVHVLRAICRRVERYCIKAKEEDIEIKYWLLYLNRLSDYFFVLSRYFSLKDGDDEILWDRKK